MKKILLKGRMIDAVSDATIEDGAVLIEGDKILYAGEASLCPETDAEVISAGEGTILPGFIDVHAHLCAGHQIGLLLDAGFTGIRDMSEAGLYLSRGVERGAIRGPRIVPGGKVLGITSGHVDFAPNLTKEYINTHDHLSMLCDGPDDCVRAVREPVSLHI